MPEATCLTMEPIAAETVLSWALQGETESGAAAMFLGIVRADRDPHRRVEALWYEAYDAMVQAQLERLLARARVRWPLQQIHLRHRVGRVPVGEIALAVVVTAVHRKEAFAALRFLVDRIKQDVPIWKRTQYDDGTQGWAGGMDAVHREESHAVV